MKQLLYLIILYTLCITSCKKERIIGKEGDMSKHYIERYIETDSIDAGIYPFVYPGNELRTIDSVGVIFHGSWVIGKDLEYYRCLYGDTAYNRPRDLKVTQDYVADYWESVNLTCNKDYDAGHPAGTSLNDIVRLNYKSPYIYIKDGYQNDELPFQQQEKLLSELTREDLLLIDCEYISFLIFNSQPEELKPMVFTLTWKAENKTVTTTFTNVVK